QVILRPLVNHQPTAPHLKRLLQAGKRPLRLPTRQLQTISLVFLQFLLQTPLLLLQLAEAEPQRRRQSGIQHFPKLLRWRIRGSQQGAGAGLTWRTFRWPRLLGGRCARWAWIHGYGGRVRSFRWPGAGAGWSV